MSDDPEIIQFTSAEGTEEGRERERAYHSALGRFVFIFAKTELAVHAVLRHYSGLSVPAARALLSGVRVDAAVGLMGRLFEVGLIDEAPWKDAKSLLDRLSEINKRRNYILHHSTISIEEKHGGLVTNAAMAHVEKSIMGFRISSKILDDMTADLVKIMTHLHAEHMDHPKDQTVDPHTERVLRSPWRYTLRLYPLAPIRKPARQDQPGKKVRTKQPKPLPE